MKDFLARASSRRFILAVLLAGLVYANKRFELGFSIEDLNVIASGFLSFIVSETLIDYHTKAGFTGVTGIKNA